MTLNMGHNCFIIKRYPDEENGRKSDEYKKYQRTLQYLLPALIINFHIVWLSLKERKPYGT